jgi:hypothetical protein
MKIPCPLPQIRRRLDGNAWLPVIAFLAGVGLTVAFHAVNRRPQAVTPVAPPQRGSFMLGTGAQQALQAIPAPVEVQFYSLLDAATVAPEAKDLARRAGETLSALESLASDKIRVVRLEQYSDPSLRKAAAEGLRPFNIERGQASYLGFVVSQGEVREVFPQLDPRWAEALPFDLARAVVRVSSAGAASKTAAQGVPEPPDPVVEAAVKALIPEPASVPLADGEKQLRQAALNEFSAAAAEGQEKLKAAQERLAQARQSGSAAAEEAAVQSLQQLQSDQTRKLQQIAALAEKRLQLFREWKASAP